MIRLTLVRHFKTPWNRDGKLQGRADISILPAQADAVESLQKELRGKNYHRVFASELRRTQETAAGCGFGDSVEISALLNETDFGEWEGCSAEELRAATSWMSDPRNVELGENFDSFSGLVNSFIQQLLAAGDADILIFGHGAWIRCCIATVEKGAPGLMNQLTVEHNRDSSLLLDGRHGAPAEAG